MKIQTAVGDDDLLATFEKRALLAALLQKRSGERTTAPLGVCPMFAAQVARAAQATALIFENTTLDRGELDRRSNQLAHYLRARGVAAEAPVGICLERSAELVVALLGVLKAGGACIPFDPSDPKVHLSLLLEEAGASLVLTEERLAERFAGVAVEVISLDGQRDRIAQESAEDVAGGPDSDGLACVLYRSSPTGRPVGVELTHRALSRLAASAPFRFTASDRVAQMASPTENAFALEVFGALAAGATLVGAPRARALSPQKIANFLQNQAISVAFLPTALLSRLAREFPRSLRSLRAILWHDDPSELRRLAGALKQEVLDRVVGF
jgi:non-ribosomal peptide synthetase component F